MEEGGGGGDIQNDYLSSKHQRHIIIESCATKREIRIIKETYAEIVKIIRRKRSRKSRRNLVIVHVIEIIFFHCNE